MKLVFVGAGKMGQSLLRGVLQSGWLEASEIGVVTKTPGHAEQLAHDWGVKALNLNDLRGVERVVLALPPREFPALALKLRHPSTGYISIMAGVTCAFLASALGTQRVVRAMPNLAATIGKSSTALTAPPEAEEAGDLEFARGLFATVGEIYPLPERLFNAFTGMSASAPAYLALIAEALADGGVYLGLSREMANHLARDALLATGELLAQNTSLALREKVASPGGTTIHGLAVLESSGVRGALIEAVAKAAARGEALAREASGDL
jgi:pyrroline-5-carboxylate reductase